MFGLGHWELLIILVVVLIIFGAGKIPEVGQKLGSGIRNFQRSIRGDDDEENKKLPEGSTPKQLSDK
jgi:sec-independent protein translocase protein TatA